MPTGFRRDGSPAPRECKEHIAPWCKIVVGGAVLNEDCANAIGADKYAKNAMETVRYAEEVYSNLVLEQ
jgi:methanogenic corrinoid protein MtbC1